MGVRQTHQESHGAKSSAGTLDIWSKLWYNKHMRKYYYALQVPPDKDDFKQRPQYYFANNLASLLWSIVTHRFWHWRRGDAWQD